MNYSIDTFDYYPIGLQLSDIAELFCEDVFTTFNKFGIDFYYYLIRYFEAGIQTTSQAFCYDLIMETICQAFKLNKEITLMNLDSECMFFQYFDEFRIMDDPTRKYNFNDVLRSPLYIAVPKGFQKIRQFTAVLTTLIDKKTYLQTLTASIDNPILKFKYFEKISKSKEEYNDNLTNWRKLLSFTKEQEEEIESEHQKLVKLYEANPGNETIRTALVISASNIYNKNKKELYTAANIKKEKQEVIDVDVDAVNDDSQKTEVIDLDSDVDDETAFNKINNIEEEEESFMDKTLGKRKEYLIPSDRMPKAKKSYDEDSYYVDNGIQQIYGFNSKAEAKEFAKDITEYPVIDKKKGKWIVYADINTFEVFDDEIEAYEYKNSLPNYQLVAKKKTIYEMK